MRKQFSFFLFIFFFSLKGFSQSPSDPIDISTINKTYLEQLIKTKIDSVRNANKQVALVNDSILYLAANYHAAYLKTNSILSHSEKDPKKKSSQLRAQFFGAKNYFVGENIAYTYVGVNIQNEGEELHINYTYEDVANDFVISWVNSPGHFSNITNQKYKITAVAVAFSSIKIYAVQNFAWVEKD